MELARASGYDDALAPEPETLAQLIQLVPEDRSLDARIYGVIRRNILHADRAAAVEVLSVAWASRLIAAVRPEALARALSSEPEETERKRLLHAATDVISPGALQTLALAASELHEQRASAQLATLLSKLELRSGRAGNDLRSTADAAYRALLHQLIEVWAAPRAELHWQRPAQVARYRAAPGAPPPEVVPEPERVVQMAFESGALGPLVWVALLEFTEDNGLRRVLGMLKAAPEHSSSAERIGQHFATPARLSVLLREVVVDFEAVDTLLRHLKLAATETLLEELVNSNSRVTRRGILDRLASLGPDIEPFIIPRLHDDRWFALRNMLHLLNEAGCPVSRVPLQLYQSHSDPRVRREVALLLLKDPQSRERGLTIALRDTDPSTLGLALRAAKSGLPDDAVPILARRVTDPDFPPEFRLPALQLIGRSRSEQAVEALVGFALTTTNAGDQPKLAAPSPELLAVLKALGQGWRNDRRAQAVLALAAASKDDQIRAAGESRGEEAG
ncbi:MAG: hypothetical protein ACRENP_16885 [Longimicrobiales bacterium]